MRALLPGFVAGFASATLITSLTYLFDKNGDSHIGYWIYVFMFACLLGCHLLGTGIMFALLKWRQFRQARLATLPLMFSLVVASYVLSFLAIVRVTFGLWVWDANLLLLVPCLLVGVVSAGMFTFSVRLRRL